MSSELPAKLSTKERTLAVTVPLLILQLALLSLQIERPAGTLLFKTWAMAAQAPVLTVWSGVTRALSGFWTHYVWTVGARAENERLRQSVRQLTLDNSAYEQIRLENERLRKLLAVSEILPSDLVGARVIAHTPNFLSNVIYVDRGSRDGVRVDAAVVAGEGIVGRTVLVSGHQSQVQLITNPDSSVGVMLESSRTPGVLRGTGDFLLDLNYVGNAEQVAVGDRILTSGLDGIYPRGLAVGRVMDSHKGTGAFRAVKVQPFEDLTRIEEVLILGSYSKLRTDAAQQR